MQFAVSSGAATTSGRVNAPVIVASRANFFARALARCLGTSVEVQPLSSYGELLEGLATGAIDVAWLPPVEALRAARLGVAQVIAVPVREGSAAFTSALFCRPGAVTTRVSELAGGRAAWVDPHSATGYVVVQAGLRAAGWVPEQLFAEQHFLGGHSEVVRAVLDGNVDVGATFVHRSDRGKVVRAGWGDRLVRILLEHGPVPSDTLVVRSQLDVEYAARIERALVHAPDVALSAAARELFEAQSFKSPSPDHFAAIERFIAFLPDAERARLS